MSNEPQDNVTPINESPRIREAQQAVDDNVPVDLPHLQIVNEIARVAHEVNHAYCQSIGQASVPWSQAPDWQRASAQAGVVTVLKNRAHGPGDLHREWLRHKAADGWTYGPIKDPEAKTHPCMVPFDELPECERIKDALFLGVVHALYVK